ncbi:MAG: hypothetical protein ACFFCI_16430 [Promethearchaeota archaeon]
MEVEYVRQKDQEQCKIFADNIEFFMKISEREVKLSLNKKKYMKFKIKLITQNYSHFFPFEGNVIDFLKDGQFLTEKGFIYGLYCFIGKAFWYSKFRLDPNSEISDLNKFLQDNNIYDNQDREFNKERVCNESKRAYQFLIKKCNLTDSFLAFYPAILEDYLIKHFNDYYF